MEFTQVISAQCQKLQPYKAGLTTEHIKSIYQIDDVYKFASNESPFPPSPGVVKAIEQAINSSNRYPDYELLKQAIAQSFALDKAHVMLGTGSINVLDLLFQLINRSGNNVVFSSHSYFAYPLLAQKSGLTANIVASTNGFSHDLDGLIAACDQNTSLLVIDSPSNLSGSALNAEQIQQMLKQTPEHTIIILDQAYIEFAEQPSLDINAELFEQHKNLVITRTFSKVHSLASLRIGYGFAHPELVNWFNRLQQPFPISNLGIAAAIAALADQDYYQSTLSQVIDGRNFLAQQLNSLGVSTLASQGNFVLGHFGKKAGQLYNRLLESGFITRQMTVYNEPDYLRISIGTPVENRRLIAAIKDRLNEVA